MYKYLYKNKVITFITEDIILEWKQKQKVLRTNNGSWKGDKVGYGALHDYIKYRLKKPEQCPKCGLDKKLDLANISQKYKREFSDWEWLCRKCHIAQDRRKSVLWQL